jgi:hypothetical protein
MAKHGYQLSSFDDGSYDDCDLAKMLVRRMDPQACTPCKTPEFPGFTHLGEFVNVGKVQILITTISPSIKQRLP